MSVYWQVDWLMQLATDWPCIHTCVSLYVAVCELVQVLQALSASSTWIEAIVEEVTSLFPVFVWLGWGVGGHGCMGKTAHIALMSVRGW